MKKYIPNTLTMFRILLVPIFIWMIFFHPVTNSAFWATAIFIIASITDYFDGMLARRFGVISNFGKLMDPLADKILVTAALFAIALPPINYIDLAAVIIIVLREISVTILRNYFAQKNVFIPANIWGKLKTTLQMIGLIGALLYYASNLDINEIVIGFRIFFWIVALVTILSGLSYFKPLFIKQEQNND